MNTLAIRINHLSKNFSLPNKKNIRVLKNISLTVEKSEIAGFIGPSGCGKTTLFNIISGIMDPDDGTVEFLPDDKKNIHSCGYMFQDSLLLPWAKAIDNIALGFTMKGIAKDIARKQASILLANFSLSKYSNFYPHMLSGGMKQKIALLRTIAFNSSLLVLDEPFGSLDSISRYSLYLYLQNIWGKFRSTMLFATHDIREAVFLSDKVYILSQKPAKVIKCVQIRIKRPRKLDIMTDQKFVMLEKKLLQILYQV